MARGWRCTCGAEPHGKRCPRCGNQRPYGMGLSEGRVWFDVTGVPRPARAFVRTDRDGRVFGGFVLQIPPAPHAEDAVWEVEIAFVRKLGEGPARHGQGLEKALTTGVLTDPGSLVAQTRTTRADEIERLRRLGLNALADEAEANPQLVDTGEHDG